MSFTAGYSNAPNSITQNLDTSLTLAFANCGNQVFDNISKNNPVFYELKKRGAYESVDAAEPYLEVPLMYGLGNAQWYQGWDTLGTQPVEGVTAAVFQWCQLACAAGYNRRESLITNPARIKDIIKVKIEQAQMTMVQSFNAALLQGNAVVPGGNLSTPIVDPATGRSGIEPLGELIYYDTTGLTTYRANVTSLQVGGLDQSVRTWWANWCMSAANTTSRDGLLQLFDEMYENTSKGAGGTVDVIFTDHTTRRLLNSAYYQVYRRSLETDNDYPFDNLMFRGAHVVCDELMPNVAGVGGGTVAGGYLDTSIATGLGSAYFINTKMMKCKYQAQTNFILTALQKPVNQDGKVGHVMWMGNTVMMNRRKHGVIGAIPRSLT